jgi:Flavin-binding monooxygenase-like
VSTSLTEVAVVGNGSSGLAVLKVLREQGIAAECFERGCEVGGLWRYEPFVDRRVLVVGGGQSAAEIAVEVSAVAERALTSMRGGVHVVPRWIGHRPYDASDADPLTRLPWPLLNRIYGWRVRRELGPLPQSWPRAHHRLLEGIPIVSSDLLQAVRRGEVVLKPAIERLMGDRVRFADGSEERVDRIVYATGYRISLPFLPSSLVSAAGRDFPLYRRIATPEVDGLFFAGFVDAPGELLPLVETQGEWIAAVLGGRLRLPSRAQIRRAIERAERRTRQRFPNESPHSIRCDPHAYRRLLQSDLRRPRRGVLHAATSFGAGRAVTLRPRRTHGEQPAG